jgi:dTMP kinase
MRRKERAGLQKRFALMNQKPIKIAVEGGDKVGKSTQLSLFAEYMREKIGDVEVIKYPVYDSPTGQVIQKYLNGKLAPAKSLDPRKVIGFYADDRLADKPRVDAAIKSGKSILFDRYVYSNMYSAARMPKSQWRMLIKYIEDLEFKVNGLIKPDLILYLYLNPMIAAEIKGGEEIWQKSARDIHEADLQLQINVAETYEFAAALNLDTWRVVNQMRRDKTRKSIDEVQANMRAYLDDFLAKSR